MTQDPQMKKVAERIGLRVRALRMERGLTQGQLARRVGTHRPLVSRVEAGRYLPTIETVCEYAEALGVSPSVVLDVVGSVPTPERLVDVWREVVTPVVHEAEEARTPEWEDVALGFALARGLGIEGARAFIAALFEAEELYDDRIVDDREAAPEGAEGRAG